MSLPISERLTVLGGRLKAKRLALNRTVQDVAFEADITPTYLWMLENPKPTKSSRPSTDVLARIARALSFSHVELGELLALAGRESLAVVAGPNTQHGQNRQNGHHAAAGDPDREAATAAPEDARRSIPQDQWMLVPPSPWVGRADELTWATERLRQGGSATIVAFNGMAGIGKSSLAAAVVQRVAHSFPDGVAIVLCQGPVPPGEILRRIIERFAPDSAASESLSDNKVQGAAYRLLQGKRALIVLDDIESGLPINFILSPLVAAGVSLLLTSREILSREFVPVEASRALQALWPDEALALFALSLGRESLGDPQVEVDARSAQRIVEALGYHTLAIKLAGIYAADAQRDLATLAEELHVPGTALQLPSGEERRRLESLLRKSIDALDKQTRTLFAALSVLGTDFGRDVVVALAERLRIPDASMNLLVLRALLTPVMQGDMPPQTQRERLRLHPLLHTLARGDFQALDAAQRDDIGHLIAHHYAEYVEKVWQRVKRSTVRNAVLGADAVNIEAAIDEARRLGDHASVVTMCSGMRYYWQDFWRTQSSLSWLRQGITSATQIDAESPAAANRLALARLHLAYGHALRRTGKLAEAEEAFKETLALGRETGDEACEAKALYELGRLARQRGKLPAAEDFLAQSRSLHHRTSDVRGEGADLGYLARTALQRGKVDEAVEQSRQSLQLARAASDRAGEAAALFQFGQIALALGRVEEAHLRFDESLAVYQEVKDVHGESSVYSQFGRIALERARLATETPERQRRLDEAEAQTRQALALANDLGDVWGTTVNLTQLGRIALERGRLDEAESYFLDSLSAIPQAQDQWNTGVNRAQLGRIALERADRAADADERRRLLVEAEHHYQEARQIAKGIPNQRGDGVNLAQLARVAYARGELDAAEERFREGLQILDSVSDAVNFVDQALAFGRFLAETERMRPEDCALFDKTVRHCATIAPQLLPGARELVQKLGCHAEE